MSTHVTIEEQEALGLRRPNSTYITPYTSHDLTATEQGLLSSSLSAAGTIMAQRQDSHHAHSDDTALTTAFASLFYSLAYSVAGAFITGGILFMAYYVLGGDEGIYVLAFLFLWGCCFLGALAYNRWQGLWFSPAGLNHHEIDSRERIAMFAIEKHVELLERKWQLKG